MTRTGARTKPQTSVTKIVTAAIAPPIRVSMSGPMPIPRRWSSEAGIVMLFHSPMSRMNRTLPDVLDGESEPKTASWRAHHGAMTRTKTATAPTAAAHEMGRRRPLGRARRPRRDRRATSASDPTRTRARARPARAGRRSGRASRDPAKKPAATNARPEPRRPRAAIQKRRDDERLVEREVVGLGHVDGREERDRDEEPGPDRHERPRARVARDRPGQRRRDRADERERQRGRPRDVAEERQERDLDDRGEGHPVRVRGDRQGRVEPGSCRRPRRRSR